MLSQEQYLILQQRTRRIEVKVELLNNSDAVIDSLEGYAISGNINIQADSAYRRSGSLKMIVNNGDLLPRANSKIWFNRKIRIFIGLKDWDEVTIWFDQGVFSMQDVSIDTSQSEKSIDVNFTDLMALIDGSMNGNLSHEVSITPEGVKVSEALRSSLSQLGKVSVDDIKIYDEDALVPYEVSVQPNASVYDLAKTLLDLYMGMEMFYDESAYLIIQRVKDRKQDPVLWDFNSENMNLTINHSSKTDFTNVRNSIYLWGRKMDSGETIKWVYRNRFSRATAEQMRGITSKEIGDICHVVNEETSYMWNEEWIVLDFTVSPEFNMEAIGEKVFAYTDEKIATIEQAMLRSEYELKNRSTLAETVNMSCVPIYGLTANSKIRFEDSLGTASDYIVKSVGVPLDISGTMSIVAEKLYY